MQNTIYKTLVELDVCKESSIIPFYPHVRDRDDVSVLRDTESGVIFLNRTDHIDLSHYEDMSGGTYWGVKNRSEALEKYAKDDVRRAQQFSKLVLRKDYVDVGCGTGGVLNLLKPVAKSVAGVELQKAIRIELQSIGYPIYRTSADLPHLSADVASLFHVFEHVINPITVLKDIHDSLRPGGIIIIEVPHARDVLLQLNSFKEFSLWSEHLILHTHESLKKFLEEAGFSDIKIHGFQRYPLTNHLGWFLNGKPGGHETLSQFVDNRTNEIYVQELEKTNQTDTLIAIAYA